MVISYLVGDKWHRLTLVNILMPYSGRGMFSCDCGAVVFKKISEVKRGKCTSCGCAKVEANKRIAENNVKHGYGRHTQKKTKTYMTWLGMRDRCNNPNSSSYSNYGGRGITYDPRWESYPVFLADMGEKPEGLSLERINNNEGYSKQNCCWADRKRQNRNKRTNVNFIVNNNNEICQKDLAQQISISETALRNRIKKWGIDHSLNKRRYANQYDRIREQEIEKCAAYFGYSLELFTQFLTRDNFSKVVSIAKTMARCILKGHKIICAGNGGSNQDSGHLVEELTGRFYKNRPSLPAIAINDAGHITCVANDYGYDYVFSKYLEAHGKNGDTFIGFTTSGNSKNIIEALKVAKQKQMNTVVMTGQQGGEILKNNLAKHILVVPSDNASNAQEIHIKVIHCLIFLIERHLGYDTLSL